MIGKYPPHGAVGLRGSPQFVATVLSHSPLVTTGAMVLEKCCPGSVQVARAARSAYVTSPNSLKVESDTDGSIMTGGIPVTVPPPFVVTVAPWSARIPALAAVSAIGGQDVQSSGMWSNPSIVEPPDTLSLLRVVSDALMSICSGRILAKMPIRWRAPPPCRLSASPPLRLAASWPVTSIRYISSFSL